MFTTDDTIVAIATPPGRGGLGVVRISGPNASRLAGALLKGSPPLEARHATLACVCDPATGETIDQVVATRFVAPHSYTGEDVVELSGHGSPVLLARVVASAVSLGARLAEPGEFTLRAYLHGRLDLPQAEAVADLVDAVTPLQARAALDQLEGTLTTAIRGIDAALFDLSARLEASLDFPEEGFHFISRPEALIEVSRVREELERLARAGRAGRVIREGRTVAIIGRPNAGKSSLFNALAGADRAIVTEIPGTTRDLLTERVDVNGLALTIVDTAGLRDARDQIEAEGVRRAQQAHQVAALTLVVIDGARPAQASDVDFLRGSGIALVVQSKADLPRAWEAGVLPIPGSEVVSVSALTGAGLSELRRRIVERLTECDDLRDVPAITNIRHLSLVDDALQAVAEAGNALQGGATEELVLADLGRARAALEEITGRRTPDDLLRHIFARFCIGK